MIRGQTKYTKDSYRLSLICFKESRYNSEVIVKILITMLLTFLRHQEKLLKERQITKLKN